jgi:hypothetical protein
MTYTAVTYRLLREVYLSCWFGLCGWAGALVCLCGLAGLNKKVMGKVTTGREAASTAAWRAFYRPGWRSGRACAAQRDVLDGVRDEWVCVMSFIARAGTCVNLGGRVIL